MMMKSVKNNVKLKDRPGFETLGMRNLYRALYPFFHCKCEFPEEITCSDEPTVFIANHYSVFGPISFILSVPFVHCAWMNEDLVTPEKTEGAVYQGVKEVFPFLKPRFIRKICSFLKPSRTVSIIKSVASVCQSISRMSAGVGGVISIAAIAAMTETVSMGSFFNREIILFIKSQVFRK